MGENGRRRGRPKGSTLLANNRPSRFRDEDNAIYVRLDIDRARIFARKILDDEEYRTNLRRRAVAGVLAPAVEMMLWHYVYGKPQETVNVNVNHKGEDLTRISDEELTERLRELAEQMDKRKNEIQIQPLN